MPYGETESELLKELLVTLGGQPAYGDSINDLLRKSILATGALVLAAQSGGGGGGVSLPSTINLIAGNGSGGAADSGLDPSGLKPTPTYTVRSADYTAVPGDRIGTDSTGAPFTITLPDSASEGDSVFIADIAGLGGNAVTITPQSGLIDGAASISINTPYDSRSLVFSKADGWRSVSQNRFTMGRLMDGGNNTSVDFENRKLQDVNGNYIVDWGAGVLSFPFGANARSVDWAARKLYLPDGVTVAFDWSSPPVTLTVDGSWSANGAAGDKGVSVPDYTAPGDFSGSDTVTIATIASLANQVQSLTKKFLALEAALAAKNLPSA